MSSHANLKRHLKVRHIRFMALGSAIGTGLFYGSTETIQQAGPAVLLAYLISGAVVYIVMRALGEMAIFHPVSGSFSHYCHDYISPVIGFITGWTYCFEMVIVAIADVTAFGIYMQYWFPGVARWIWVLAVIFFVGAINLFSVKVFGELEFWFSLLKVFAIILMILAGCLVIVWGVGSTTGATGIHSLWDYGGFFPHGWHGLLFALPLAMFAFGGIEVMGITAGEADSPERAMRKAINSVPTRILIFYVGTLFVLMSIQPWNQIGTGKSPFVQLFEHLGISWAASLLNIIVITASLSAINSDFFGAGRMMYGLSKQGQAPKLFSELSLMGIPWVTVIIMTVALLIGMALNYLMPEQIFVMIASLATFATLWVWIAILWAQIMMRRQLSSEQVENLNFRLPAYPWSALVAIAFMLLVIILIGYLPASRISLYVGIIWLLLLAVVFYSFRRKTQFSQY